MSAIESAIVGIKFHPGSHDKLLETKDGEPVALVRQPDNKYDPNAVACEIDGQMCGFVPADQAKTLAPDIDAGRRVTATLHGYSKLTIEVEDEPDRAAAE